MTIAERDAMTNDTEEDGHKLARFIPFVSLAIVLAILGVAWTVVSPGLDGLQTSMTRSISLSTSRELAIATKAQNVRNEKQDSTMARLKTALVTATVNLRSLRPDIYCSPIGVITPGMPVNCVRVGKYRVRMVSGYQVFALTLGQPSRLFRLNAGMGPKSSLVEHPDFLIALYDKARQ